MEILEEFLNKKRYNREIVIKNRFIKKYIFIGFFVKLHLL